MALGSQLPIRLDAVVEARLQAAADKAGTSKSALIRLLATTFVDQCVDSNGRVTLPPNWQDLLPSRDARSDGHRVKIRGDNNATIVGDFKSASGAPARKPAQSLKGKRGSKPKK